MDRFGVQFLVKDPQRFETLSALFAEIKRDKDAGQFREPNEWVKLVPDDIKGQFAWPTIAERERWLTIRPSTPILVPEPSEQIGAQWDFYRVFESVEESEYDLVTCELVNSDHAEMVVNPQAYPYGGVGPLIALAEAFGFTVLGVNECGEFETREELLRAAERPSTLTAFTTQNESDQSRPESPASFMGWLRRWLFGNH